MNYLRVFAALSLFLALAYGSRADVVALKNGDRLTGSIGNSDGKTLTLKTEYAGEVKVEWSAIKEVTADKPLYVVTADKRTVNGVVSLEGADLVIHPTSAAPLDVPIANLAAVRTAEGQAAYDKSLHPGLLEGWNDSVTIGFSLARGNSDTTNLNTGFNLDRKTLNDHIAVYESSLYSTNGQPGGGVTANAILGGARYDHNISKSIFVFGSGDFTHDELQDLNIRAIYSGGLGWHAINRPNTTLDILGGINYTHESYGNASTAGATSSLNRNLPGITAGEDFTHKFGASTMLAEHFYFYPDLSDISQYRISLDASLVTKIKTWLAWQTTVSDRYVTNPPIIGTKSNDVIVSTGLNVAFKH